MKNLYVVAVLIVILISNSALADTLKNKKAIRHFCDGVMEKVASGDLISAFNSMKPYVDLSSTEIDAAAVQSKVQREQYGKRYGDPIEFEFIDEEKIGTSLIRLRFIEKTNKHALPWIFHFYKTPEGWTLNAFNWNDQFQKLF